MKATVRRVYVFRFSHEFDGKVSAYTCCYVTNQGAGACVHDVEAVSGYEAKKIAAREHRDKCGNRVTRFS